MNVSHTQLRCRQVNDNLECNKEKKHPENPSAVTLNSVDVKKHVVDPVESCGVSKALDLTAVDEDENDFSNALDLSIKSSNKICDLTKSMNKNHLPTGWF